MRTLLIDNYDSFTHNLYQLLWEVNGTEPVVVRNDAAGWGELAVERFEAVVISPGPGRPERRRDFGVCAEAILRCEEPLLGVCLGHQGIGWAHGGEVVPAAEPMHGRVDRIEHTGDPLFAGIPSGFAAARYHSLRLARPLPAQLTEIASGAEGVPMAIAHRSRPQWGVQFHPESVATEHGHRLLENFRDLAAGARRGSAGVRPRSRPAGGGQGPPGSSGLAGGRRAAGEDGRRAAGEDGAGGARPRLLTRHLAFLPDPEAAFGALYGGSRAAFWLDSASAGRRGRCSFMGDASGPLAATLRYDVGAGQARITRDPTGAAATEVAPGPLLGLLERERRRLAPADPPPLPFRFDCGFAGYLGYELKAGLGGEAAHRSPHPDAAFVLADRLLAFDHDRGETFLLCLAGPGGEAEAERWLATTEALLAAVRLDAGRAEPVLAGTARRAGAPPAWSGGEGPRLARSRRRYLDDIDVCLEALRAGESYEICVTNRVEVDLDADPLALYHRLRRANPAPFAAYLRCGELAVLSSSPERFLAVDRDGRAEARPVKGTTRRDPDRREDARLAAALAADEKSRAENLMIADLLRNDLGVVCEPGSVETPSLFAIESYETVHQLVSTVRGQLRPGLGAIDAVGACFPPGSMTGAPKRRTMEILDRLEGAPRGVYSGAIGYLGLSGGCDLSVAIRTIVLADGRASVGAGGAIVAQSDPAAELEEMLLKAAAPLRAVDPEARPGAAAATVSGGPEG